MDQPIHFKRGASQKQGCIFYVAFTRVDCNSDTRFRCRGICAIHKCKTDSNTWDHYTCYRNADPVICEMAAELMANRIELGQAASFLNSKYDVRIQPKDLHYIVQTNC